MNRLARERSPYLLQHAHNPVDWYPWGPEAFARALAEESARIFAACPPLVAYVPLFEGLAQG